MLYTRLRGSALGHHFESFGVLEGYCHALCFEPKCVTRLGCASVPGRAGAAEQIKPVWRLVRFRGAELNLTAQSHLGRCGEAAPETRPVVSGGVCDKGFSIVWPRSQARCWGGRQGLHTAACPLQASTARPSGQELRLVFLWKRFFSVM